MFDLVAAQDELSQKTDRRLAIRSPLVLTIRCYCSLLEGHTNNLFHHLILFFPSSTIPFMQSFL